MQVKIFYIISETKYAANGVHTDGGELTLQAQTGWRLVVKYSRNSRISASSLHSSNIK